MPIFSHKLPPQNDQPGEVFGSYSDSGRKNTFDAQPDEASQRSPFEFVEQGAGTELGKPTSSWRFTWHFWTGLICLLLAVLIVVFMIILPLNGKELAATASSVFGIGGTVVTGVLAWVAVGLIGLVATGIGLYFEPSRKASVAVLLAAILVTTVSVISIQSALQSITSRVQYDVQQGVLTEFDLEALTPDGVDQIVGELGVLNLDDKGAEVTSEEERDRIPLETRAYLEDELQNRFE